MIHVTRQFAVDRTWSEPFIAAVPSDHPLAKVRKIRLRELAREPFVSVVRWSSPDMYDRMIHDVQAAGVTLSIVEEAGSFAGGDQPGGGRDGLGLDLAVMAGFLALVVWIGIVAFRRMKV